MIDAAGLRVMRAIAEQGSFTAAAASLGYTQPAISQMVRRLEQRCGTVLVERRGRSVFLTHAGQVLADHAVTILEHMELAEQDVAAIAGLSTGRVRLSAFPSAATWLVPRALASVLAEHPEFEIEFSEAEPTESLAMLRSGRVDLVVAFTYENDCDALADREGLVAHRLGDDPLLAVLPETHALADADEVDLADLAAEPWIAGCPQCRGHLVSLASDAGFVPRVQYQSEDYVAIFGFVRAGLGVSVVPRLLRDGTSTEGVVVRPLTQPSKRTIEVITTPDLARVPAVHLTLEALRRVAASRTATAEHADAG